MTYQRILLRLASFAPAIRSYLSRRTWRVEAGVGAGLRITFPQNREFIEGTSELPVQRRIASLVKPGDVFYDVGANVGFFSIIAARLVGPSGKVCSFEPLPSNAAAIRRNAGLNSFSHLEMFEMALGDRSGTDSLQVTDWDGGSAITSSTVPVQAVRSTTVRIMRLDELTASGAVPDPHFVKIDVEGAEEEVLRGMRETLLRARPILLYEVDDGDESAFRRRWESIDAWVAALCYRIERIEPSYPELKWHVGHTLATPADCCPEAAT